MDRIATFAFAAACAALSATAGAAASEGAGSGELAPDLRGDMESCAASTRALAVPAMPAPDTAGAAVAVVPRDAAWSLGHPAAEESSGGPVGDAGVPVPQLVSARSAFIRGPDGTIDEFSLRGTLDAIRLTRGCSDL
jgi:hypothetical protein